MLILKIQLQYFKNFYFIFKIIIQAKKKPLKELKIDDLQLDYQPKVKILEVNEPPTRQGGINVKDVDELIEKLMNEAKMI